MQRDCAHLAHPDTRTCVGRPRVTLFLGGATYVWYTAATSLSLSYTTSESTQFAIMIPSAVLLGLGAGSLWTAQGCVHAAKPW